MPYDQGLAARVSDVLHTLGERGFREKNVFGGRGFLLGKTTFLVVWDNGIIVKAAAGEYQRLLAVENVQPFAPGGEKPMSTWLTVPMDLIADDPELADWVREGLRAVR